MDFIDLEFKSAQSTVQHNVIHYLCIVQVTRGGSPVVEADIEVNITVRLENGSTARVDNITMVDNGYGGECQSVSTSYNITATGANVAHD